MTNNDLRADLISEIKDMEAFFRALPPDVCERYDLTPGVPLTVRFGPDADFAIVDKNRLNVFRAGETLNESEISRQIEKVLDNEKINIRLDVNTDGNKFVEIRLNPARALKVCEDQEKANAIIENFVHGKGWSVYPISSHPHMSETQADKDLFKSEPTGNHSTLFKHTVAQMLSLQERFSAFFIRPFRAEQNPDVVSYEGAAVVSFDAEAAGASVRGRNFTSPARTIEPRISPDDPYQAAYLYMRAAQRALEGRDEEYTNSASLALSLNKNFWQQGSWPDSVPENNSQIRRGAGGYLKMLEQTAQSLRDYPDVFPEHIAHGMMRASIEGYERYFRENHKAKPHEIGDLRSRIDALKAGFFKMAEAPVIEPA